MRNMETIVEIIGLNDYDLKEYEQFIQKWISLNANIFQKRTMKNHSCLLYFNGYPMNP